MTTNATRAAIEATYKTMMLPGNAMPVVSSPGPFDMEPLFVPYFVERIRLGEGTYTPGSSEVTFILTDDDLAVFPELAGARAVTIIPKGAGSFTGIAI